MLESEEKTSETVEENAEERTVTALPTFTTYEKKYANSCAKNDQKALKIFKEYESVDLVRRLRGEMMAVSKGKVVETAADRIIGKNRKLKFGSYEKWGRMMLAQLQLK
ncbi:MAG: hypothetical protein IT290_09465 [Deltaproteobacteria bacterium]|nr:hypothetical protein [Deltaproteobacteria bacterium]